MDNPIPQNITKPLVHDPFGMITFGRSWEAGSGYRYGFNGMEGDDEIVGNDNALDFGARVYDGRLGRWLSIDPLYKEFPSIGPYTSFNNSPIMYRDPNGKTFYISGDTQTAMDDITGMLSESNRKYVTFTEIEPGLFKVDINLEGGLKNNDAGANLLIILTTTSENYFYTVSNTYQVLQTKGTGSTKSVQSKEDDLTKDHPPSGISDGKAYGVMNFSETEYHAVEEVDEKKLKGNSRLQPVDAYGIDIDGQVYVAQTGTWVHFDGSPYERSELAFHELWENYERTTNGIAYHYYNFDRNGNCKYSVDRSRPGAHQISNNVQNGLDPTREYYYQGKGSSQDTRRAGNGKYVPMVNKDNKEKND